MFSFTQIRWTPYLFMIFRELRMSAVFRPNLESLKQMTNKKCFTLDQVVGIANHFHVSIDRLIGNQHSTSHDLSPRAIGEYFARLIEHDDLKAIRHPIEEFICEPYYDHERGGYDTRQYRKSIDYYAFYFPQYWQIPEGLSEEQYWEYSAEMEQCGNETAHCQTNLFFHQFLQIHNLYKQNALEEETYRTVVADLLSHLRE